MNRAHCIYIYYFVKWNVQKATVLVVVLIV